MVDNKDIKMVDENSLNIDSNFGELEDIDLGTLDLPESTPQGLSISKPKKWKNQYYIGYLGLNFLTMYKENKNTLQLLVILNPDKNKLRFLIETLKEHREYIDNKLYNDTNISDEDARFVMSILNNVYEKIELLENLKNFIFPQTDYINKDSDINLLQLLNDPNATRDLINYYKNCNYNEDNINKLKNLINSINIIVNMMDPDFFGDPKGYEDYSINTYQYLPAEREALRYIEAPTALMENESIIKPKVNTDVEVLKRDTSRYYFKKVTLDLLNLYHARVYAKQKPNLVKIVGYIK